MEIINVVVELTEVGFMVAAAYGLRAVEVHLKRREQERSSERDL
ncbi:MAG TPA: hypothetical protein VGD78_09195 [Chthoniobacterales bacterium]